MHPGQHSSKQNRQRKFLVVFPLLVTPFLLVIFWALGGGKAAKNAETISENNAGINYKLPDAHFKKEKAADKLALYELAAKDSLKWKEALKNDPYYTGKAGEVQDLFRKAASPFGFGDSDRVDRMNFLVTTAAKDSNEEKIMQKINLLKQQLATSPSYPKQNIPTASRDEENIKSLVNSNERRPRETDPEIKQLSSMLDKVMAIEHIGQQENANSKENKKNAGEVYSVLPANTEVVIESANPFEKNEVKFYGLDSTHTVSVLPGNTMEAVVAETSTLVTGAIIKLQLLQPVTIHGVAIPNNSFVFGAVSVNNERLKISINSIRYLHYIFPVSLDAYDTDGISGIYIPGSINRDVAKQSADQAISDMGLTTLDPSLSAQAASAGIQAAKTLISKKVRIIRVTVKAGYKLFLKDANQK